VDELVEWLRTSKHETKAGKGVTASSESNLYTKQEVLKLQALYYEERRKV
jgi:hypothetical protein